MRSAVTISLVPEARGGPFVFWDDLERSVATAAELGFDAVEIFAPGPESFDEALEALLKKHRVALAAVGTGAGWVKHRLSLTASEAAVRAQAQDFIRSMIDAASRFGAGTIIGSMQGRFEGGVSRETALGWLAEGLEQLGGHAAERGAALFYEPLNRYETNLLNRAEDVARFLDGFDSGGVKVLCDLFHMNMEEQSIAGGLRTIGERLGHVHFVDSNRRPAGYGHIDFDGVVRALRETGYKGYLSAECLPYPDSASAAKSTIEAIRQALT